MRDLLSWNLSLGRWGGVHVRVHVFFLLFALIALNLGSTVGGSAMGDGSATGIGGSTGAGKLFWESAAALAILFLSVLAHEFGHCLAAWRAGGGVDHVLLWPLGGLTQVNLTHDPQNELVTAVSGPLVNLAICLMAAPALIVKQCNLADLLNPLLPPVAAEGLSWLNACQWTFWINWLLALVNCLPALPLDMGRVLRAMLWMQHDFRHGVVLAARVAQLTAVGLWIAAWLIHRSGGYSFAALPLALIGVLLFFGAKQETDRLYDADNDDAPFGYDFSQGYTSLEKATHPRKAAPGPVKKWLTERRLNRLQRQQQLEADEERRVDEVLMRLHELGMHGLSEEDRALLNRVSARYRNRLRQ